MLAILYAFMHLNGFGQKHRILFLGLVIGHMHTQTHIHCVCVCVHVCVRVCVAWN